MNTLYRALPSVDVCLIRLHKEETLLDTPRPLMRMAITQFLDTIRHDIRTQKITDASSVTLDALWTQLLSFVIKICRPRLRRVLNATGVVIHTNMGRSVLAQTAVEAVCLAAAGYSNLELNLETGMRGSRQELIEELLCILTGAESAMAVNNNAAAVLLTLDTFCKGREVIVSRGQLVEIGGSFRIPEVMEKSGAVLREVGATNRTHTHDYATAITENTAALLRVHTSNYRIVGFHKEVSLSDLVALGQEHNLPVIEDLGSGCLMDFTPYGLPDEPTVQAVVQAGAAIVTCSGDKVFGGPQAGIIVGQKKYIEQLRKNPLHRALRCDKFTLAALEATLRLYLEPEKALHDVPTLRMITTTAQELAQRAQALQHLLQETLGSFIDIHLQQNASRVGGGSFPERDLPTTLVCLHTKNMSVTDLKQKLLHTSPPLLGRLEENHFCLDPRTLQDADMPLVVESLSQAFRVCF